MSLPVVAIVGRPNVGKSTLFNRILGFRLAVVHDEPGITRDRLGAMAEWNGRSFQLVDTGGWIPETNDRMDAAILDQVLRAMDACDLVLFVVDARQGLHPHDREIGAALFRRNMPVLLVANKTDHQGMEAHAAEFSAIGFENQFSISASEGRGIGDLLDAVVAGLPHHVSSPEQASTIRIAILGRPNVGKSSLVNRLLQEERMIVDDRPGTTRDAVDSELLYHGRSMILVDTAGLRRKLDSQPAWEFYATLRAMRALERADVAVLVLDGLDALNRQDVRIADLLHQSEAAVVVVVNKWDQVVKDTSTTGVWIRSIQESMPFLNYAPVEFISALTAQRISRVPQSIVRVYEEARREVPTAAWNEALERAVAQNPPSSHRGQRPARFYYVTQVRTAPPMIALFVSDPSRVPQEYLRYLGRQFRETFGFEGSRIRIVLRKS